MVGLSIFILALLVLYILSRIFIQKLFTLFYHWNHDQEQAAQLLGWIFLPGTFIHEIAHFLAALFLLVPVGKINLMPEIDGGHIRLGSVAVGKSDFIRGSLIGLAPLIAGGGLIYWGVSYLIFVGLHANPWILVGVIYLIFEVSHTMFSSKRDLYAVLELVAFVIIISFVLLYFKIYGPFEFIAQRLIEVNQILERLAFYLAVPILLEIIGCIII